MIRKLIARFLILVFLNTVHINACARMNNNNNVVTTSTITTTTTTSQCANQQGQVLLYEDSSFVSGSNFYGQVPASSTCISCSSGSSQYFPDSGAAVINSADKKAIAEVNCQNFCACQADGTCFQRNSGDTSIVLYPYCDGSACNVYVLVLGENNSDGIVSTDGATTVTANSQVDPTTSNFYPVNQNNRFPIVTSASCNGCNVPKSC